MEYPTSLQISGTCETKTDLIVDHLYSLKLNHLQIKRLSEDLLVTQCPDLQSASQKLKPFTQDIYIRPSQLLLKNSADPSSTIFSSRHVGTLTEYCLRWDFTSSPYPKRLLDRFLALSAVPQPETVLHGALSRPALRPSSTSPAKKDSPPQASC